MRLRPVTLRLRVAAWCAATLMALIGGFALLLYLFVRSQLLRLHDHDLAAVGRHVEEVLGREADCAHLTPDQVADLDMFPQLVLVHSASAGSEVFYRSPGRDAALLSDKVTHSPSPGTPSFLTDQHDGEPLRVYVLPYRSHVGRQGAIRVVQRLGDVAHPLASLRLALVIFGPLAALLSAGTAWWIAGRALTPLEAMSRLAQEIGASRLDRRLPEMMADDEIASLTRTFNEMIERLETSFAAMKRFTSDAAHELRGPLTTLRGAIDVALANPRRETEYRAVLSDLGEEVDRLRRIAEDLLMLARADAGRIRLERTPVRLDVLATEVADALLPAAVAAGVSLGVRATEAAVEGDERWLRQLVFNLTDNAIKFTARSDRRRDPAVTVETRVVDGNALLVVRDTGPGIPASSLPHVFERFFRADDARPAHGPEGSGLGLAIAKWIADAHGAAIRAENEETGGCRMTVTFAAASRL